MIKVQQLAQEYLALKQTIETVVEITAKLRESAFFYPQYATTKEMKMTLYHDMLRTEIL